MRNLENINRVVIKIGSSTVAKNDGQANLENIHKLVEQIYLLTQAKIEVLLVTSGAIAIGFNQLNFSTKPKAMELKQACAAVGQAKLMQIYEQTFNLFDLKCGQILLNHDDFENRKRMINLKNTIRAMLEQKIIPIINENDALMVEEIKVGDNDTLSAFVCPLVDADLLILISDIDGLYDKNPHLDPNANLIVYVSEITEDIIKMATSSTSKIGTGGMITKIKAAKIANDSGCHMVILNGNNFNNISELFKGVEIGTWFVGKDHKLPSKTHWIIYNSNPKGEIIVDEGARIAVMKNRSSLLPSGVIDVKGNFLIDSIVSIKDREGNLIAKGITSFSSDEIKRIKGLKTLDIKELIQRNCKHEVIHANNIVITNGGYYESK